MDLLIIRSRFSDTHSAGELFIDGIKFCDTLEDTDRGLDASNPKKDIVAKKKAGKTAIPTGVYNWKMEYSPAFKRVLPTILNVPGFEYIRIHGGNTTADTAGCPLVGIKSLDFQGLVKSNETLNKLLKKLKGKSGTIEIISI